MLTERKLFQLLLVFYDNKNNLSLHCCNLAFSDFALSLVVVWMAR